MAIFLFEKMFFFHFSFLYYKHSLELSVDNNSITLSQTPFIESKSRSNSPKLYHHHHHSQQQQAATTISSNNRLSDSESSNLSNQDAHSSSSSYHHSQSCEESSIHNHNHQHTHPSSSSSSSPASSSTTASRKFFRNNKGETELHLAAIRGDFGRLEHLLQLNNGGFGCGSKKSTRSNPVEQPTSTSSSSLDSHNCTATSFAAAYDINIQDFAGLYNYYSSIDKPNNF